MQLVRPAVQGNQTPLLKDLQAQLHMDLGLPVAGLPGHALGDPGGGVLQHRGLEALALQIAPQVREIGPAGQ